MSSEKPKAKRVRKEEPLYEPVLNTLRTVLSCNYVESEIQTIPVSRENPYLKITKRSIPEAIKKVLDSKALQALSVEELRPDIMGFVKRKSSSPKELITVEVKATPITINNVWQAKLYQHFFNPTFNLLVSSKGISEKKLRFVLENDVIRGKTIIAKLVRQPMGYLFEIDQRFENLIPTAFKNCIIHE